MKAVLIVVTVLIVAALSWFLLFGSKLQNKVMPNANPINNNAYTQSQTTTVTPQNSTDSSINKDLNNLDTELNSVDQSTKSVDQGLNDTPVPQPAY